MATKVPANEHTQKLLQLIKRYDVDELLDAATTFQYWPVISNDEKTEIQKQSGSSKQQKFDSLITLVTKKAERMTRFAMFIQCYTSPIQEAALSAVLECQNSVAIASASNLETVTNTRVQNENTTLAADQKSFDSNSTAQQCGIFVGIDTANSQEHYPMENRASFQHMIAQS